MRRIAAVLVFFLFAGCSFSEDWGRFTGGPDANDHADAALPSDAGVDAAPGGDASEADATPPADPCTVADPSRLLCADFNVPPVNVGWTSPILSNAGDAISLDSSEFHSGPTSAKFSVIAGAGAYAELFQTVKLVDKVEITGWLRLDGASLAAYGTTAVIGLSLNNPTESDEILLEVHDGTNGQLVHNVANPNYQAVPLTVALPLNRFFKFALHRDGVARQAHLDIDDVDAGDITLTASAPAAATLLEVRVGVVSSSSGPLSIRLDDIVVRSE